MDLRLLPASLLLLGNAAIAQIPLPPAGQTPPPAQDPDKPAPTPAEVAKQLQAERDRLAREIAYVQDRAKNAKALLADKLASKPQTFKTIDAGVNAASVPPMAPTQPRAARVATAEELGNHANDTLLIVNGRAIPQKAFDDVVQYLAASPSSGDEPMRAQRALFDLIRIEAVASAFEDNEAAERVGELLGQLDAGKTPAELAKAVGTVPGASPEGKIEVTRNSVFGPRFEQVAFTTEAGKRARPFRNANGLVILHIDSIEKGATPDLDKAIGTAIQVPYSPDQAALQKAHLAVNTGQVDVLARDQKTIDMLPEMFRRAMTPAPGQDLIQQGTVELKPVDNTAAMKQLEQLSAEMAALQGKTDEQSKKRLQALQQQYIDLKVKIRGGSDEAPVEIKQAPTEPVKKN